MSLKGPLPPSAPGNAERLGLSGAISKLSALLHTRRERLMETLNGREGERGRLKHTLKKRRERKLDEKK